MELNKEISYKDLCKIFGEKPVSGGNNRDKQLMRFQKKYEIEKVGRGKYTITREKSKEEVQLNSDKEQYSKYLQAVMLNMIANSESVSTVYTYRQLRENLFMVNSKYFPVKYHKQDIDYDMPYNYDPLFIQVFEKQWFDIADQHDESTIKYALKSLFNKNLITNLKETYIFYKFEKDENGNTIFHQPIEATDEQLAEIHQRQLDFIKNNLGSQRIKYIEKTYSDEKFFGGCLRDLFQRGQKVVQEYYQILLDYTKEIGSNRYARGFRITRPTNLKRIAGFFAPEFNEKQVQRYLQSPRFKTIPPFVHQQLTKQLIEKSPTN